MDLAKQLLHGGQLLKKYFYIFMASSLFSILLRLLESAFCLTINTLNLCQLFDRYISFKRSVEEVFDSGNYI